MTTTHTIYRVEYIREVVAKAFPGWSLIGISATSINGWQWEDADKFLDFERPEQMISIYEMAKLADKGVTKVCFKLTHKNGGEARPDYFVEEFAETFKWKPLDQLTIHANQGDRDAYVLAVIEDEALIEYDMPKGSTAMWVIDAYNPEPGCKRNIAYRSCPKKWLDAMEEAGTQWEGRGQGMRHWIDQPRGRQE